MDLPRITFHRTIIPQSCDSEFSGHACGATVCQLWQCVLEVRLIVHVLSFFGPCVAPPAARSRTLQWDTDPSVLQLQADSELGYFLPPLSFCCSFPLIIFPLAHSLTLSLFQCPIQCLSIFPCPSCYLPSFVCPLLGPPTLILLLFKFVGFKCFQLATLQLFARGCVWHWLIYPNQYRCRELFHFHS